MNQSRTKPSAVLVIAAALSWLVVGAVLTVATATILPCLHLAKHFEFIHGATWPMVVPKGWPAPDMKTSETCCGRSTVRTFFWDMMGYPSRWGSPTVVQVELGYPLPCFSGWGIGEPPLNFQWHGVMAYGRQLDKPSILIPYLPLWPGFALNTLFYAALAWGAWQLPLALRRRRRRVRGQCVRCGYDLAGLPKGSQCPECGPSTST